MKMSTAWIEDSNVYAFSELIPGTVSKLSYYKMKERQFKDRVKTVVGSQVVLANALRQSDPKELTRRITPLIQFDSVVVKKKVIDAMAESGPKCLPCLRAIIRDDSLVRDYEDSLMNAMAKAGGSAVGPDLTEIVQQELAFWRKTGPSLKGDWWSGIGEPWDVVEGHRFHYSRALAAIKALNLIKYPNCRDAVVAIRDLWRSVPQLRGIDGLITASDELLADKSKAR
jgi:hypothetical protein